LKRLQGKIPRWLELPASVAIPFGVFEKVLTLDKNRDLAKKHEALIEQLEIDDTSRRKILADLHKTVLALKEPDGLATDLRRLIRQAGLPWPGDWKHGWKCIKGVWASKWNERAYLSRRAGRIAHENLFMAVLIQEVVEADYSFVIHTANPFSGNKDEIYGEVVSGLGETLVGNYPGKALSFTCRKTKGKPRLLSFPSKSTGLFGGGLIFRSDSNGEDLENYAGAGLYDSVMFERPKEVLLDYTNEKLLEDASFLSKFLDTLTTVGTVIEKSCGSPQDIEGAFSKGKYYVVQTRPQVGV